MAANDISFDMNELMQFTDGIAQPKAPPKAPYCYLCNRIFTNLANRSTHILACEAIKEKTSHLEFQCNYCPRKFETGHHTNLHMQKCIKYKRVSVQFAFSPIHLLMKLQ